MSIEEKAKAYDEALKKIQPLYEQAKRDGNPIWSTYEYLMPELRETEDERIRKELIFFLKEEIPQCSIKEHAEKLKEFVAWLEKQKYDRMKPIYDARESFESALEKAWNDYHNGYENVDKLEDDYVECAYAKGFREGYLFGIEKQKEQVTDESDKVAAAYQLGRSDERKQKEQKPAEWSEKHIADVFEKVGLAKIVREQANDALTNAVQSAMIELSKAGNTEWSEEDEDYMNAIIAIINRETALYPKGGATEDLNNDLIVWLKSLRPQPQGTYKLIVHNIYEMLKDKDFFDIPPSHRVSLLNDIRVRCKNADEQAEILDVPSWKPSEHQMTILKAVKEYVGRGSGYWGEALGSLIEDLEKLM